MYLLHLSIITSRFSTSPPPTGTSNNSYSLVARQSDRHINSPSSTPSCILFTLVPLASTFQGRRRLRLILGSWHR
ncbi:hypothetical protein EJ03DRAFT_323399 [Teratosphaeria nubilosa]|uniref:Uncharacterized protein n=1 Tax=Teratosphaeria nubilosa TaxID=161662 RepID=A0A6G1LPG4_9PEZI|nr:hypothetical protein EJ03DRAFT_323399 [Teratosphaeria nubilosa]